MSFFYQRCYRGPVQAVILDWAGTTVDFGSLAPVRAISEVFAQHGVPITPAEARGPMGIAKREHIARVARLTEVNQRWVQTFGRSPTEMDIDFLYESFVPLQIDCLAETAAPVPGCVEAIEQMRARGYRIGANTGYNREMLERLESAAAEYGYRPDSSVCAADVARGRPYPDMCLLNALELEIDTVHACVKVDDTTPGIEEGLNAGMWTIGVAVSGNEVGLSLLEWNALSEAEQRQHRDSACQHLHRAGAHYVIDSVAQILPCLDDIEMRLARGEKP